MNGVFQGMQPTPTSVRAPSQPGFASRTALIERRQADRQAATGSILISPGNEGALLDWSAGGFSAESNLAVRVGATYRLRRRLGETPQCLTGVVRWSRLRRTIADPGGDVTPVFHSGFELVVPT